MKQLWVGGLPMTTADRLIQAQPKKSAAWATTCLAYIVVYISEIQHIVLEVFRGIATLDYDL